jgi:predicted Na+-dependent transporter
MALLHDLFHDVCPIALQATLFLLALAIGLDASIDDALLALRRPRRLLRALPALLAAGLLALVTLPLAAALLGTLAGRHGGLAPLALAGDVIVWIFVPLAAGMAIRVVVPHAATRAARAIGRCAGLALFLAGAAALTSFLSLPA